MDCEIHRLAPLRRQHEFDPGAEHRAGAGHGRSLRPQDVPVQPAHRQPAPTGGTDPAVEAAALAGGVTGTHRRSQSRGRKENLRGEVPRLPPRSTGIAGGRGNRPEPRQQLRAARGQNAVSGSRGAYSEGSQGTSISGRRDQQGRTGGHGRESRNLAGHRQVHGANAVGDLATAPYLHNASVPTLYHLLHPDQRPQKFLVGNREFDPEKVGYQTTASGPDVWEFDTSQPGNSNIGHAGERFGTTLPEEQKAALLEYLKTL